MMTITIKHLLTWTHLSCPNSVAFNPSFTLELFGEFFKILMAEILLKPGKAESLGLEG